MSSYLLDTCVALWYFAGSERLPARVQAALTDPANDLFLSEVSALEIVLKYRTGKLSFPQPPSKLLVPLMRRHLMDLLPLELGDIFRLETLVERHRDPFDRLLIAQAMNRRLTLVSPDPLIRQYEQPCFWE